jgi:hypothetical protein
MRVEVENKNGVFWLPTASPRDSFEVPTASQFTILLVEADKLKNLEKHPVHSA